MAAPSLVLLTLATMGPRGALMELHAAWEHYLPQAEVKEILVAPGLVTLLSATAKRKLAPALPTASAVSS